MILILSLLCDKILIAFYVHILNGESLQGELEHPFFSAIPEYWAETSTTSRAKEQSEEKQNFGPLERPAFIEGNARLGEENRQEEGMWKGWHDAEKNEFPQERSQGAKEGLSETKGST